jgi:hypothetical protein
MMNLIRVSAALAALVGATSAHAQATFDMKGGWSGPARRSFKAWLRIIRRPRLPNRRPAPGCAK